MSGGWGIEMNGFGAATAGLEAVAESYGAMETHTVKSDVEYAIYVEFGTRYMPANGALRSAIDAAMANLGSIIGDVDDPDDITKKVAEAIAEDWRRDVWVDTGRLKSSIHVAKVG